MSDVANGDAGRLHRIARTVIQANEENPQPWFEEWAEWLTVMVGVRPKEELGNRAHENWNLVALGTLLAWDYFADALKDDGPEDGTAVDASHVADDSDDIRDSVVAKPHFTVLGPDGQPLVEGVR